MTDTEEFDAALAKEFDQQEEEKPRPEPQNVWMVVSFYLDESSTFRDVMRDARTEREVRGSNVLIFAHDHDYAFECSKKCKQVK